MQISFPNFLEVLRSLKQAGTIGSSFRLYQRSFPVFLYQVLLYLEGNLFKMTCVFIAEANPSCFVNTAENQFQ